MPGIEQISEALGNKYLEKADEHYKHSKVGSLLKLLKGLATPLSSKDNGEPYNNGIIPDICRLDELPALVGVGEKALEGLMKAGVFKGYKRAGGSGNATRVVKEQILCLINYLSENFNYTDYKWKSGDVDIE